MKDFVSKPWIRVVVLALSLFLVGTVFMLRGYPWTGLVWMGLASAAALWIGRSSNRSIAQVLDAIEAEPVPVPAPAANPGRKTSH